jgi:Zn-dependent M16 (insulinase) family peptidase
VVLLKGQIMANTTPEQGITKTDKLEGFVVEKIESIPELHTTAYLFTHEKTGARVLHLYNDDENNLFSIGFRTPVYDCTGVPHILEHSVLCGSKKFPLKDPFQELLKGSLQTFLNALTYPDKTIYPVSSQVEKDFYNLVDVYCDAVFNPLLTENTFYQEGWHFDVEDMSKPVGIKGIVYNEMKGVFSNFSSHVDRKTLSELFPETTYYFESGGEPEHITDLTYEMFCEFHRKYYHPSNSFIVLYGNLPSEKSLRFLNSNYLGSFDKLVVESEIKPQALWDKPRSVQIEAPAPEEDNGLATVALIWIFGNTTDPVTTLAGRIISHYLLGTESSPLKRALIDSGLGEDLDDISGFDSELVQTVFAAGLRKSKPENSLKIQQLILDTLQEQVTNGLDEELLEGSLRQIEFGLREITSGHFPYNLRLAERSYRSWIYGGDPLAHLAFEKPLGYIKEQYAKGQGYFVQLIKDRLLDNQHRLLSTVIASSEMGKQLAQQTEEQAVKLTSEFDIEKKQYYHELTKELLTQQKAQTTPEALATLPRLEKKDLPQQGKDVPAIQQSLQNVTVYTHPIFTSGVVYFDIGFNFESVPLDLIKYIPMYMELITRCGAGGKNYEDTAKRIALATGGIDSSVLCKTKPGTSDDLFFYGFLHGKSIVSYVNEMVAIIKDLLLSPDLTNKKQIKDILLEERNSLHSSVIGAGHHFAMSQASSNLTKSRNLDERMGGISQLRFLDDMVKSENVDQICNAMTEIHQIVINRNAAVLSITADNPDGTLPFAEELIRSLPSIEFKKQQYPFEITIPKNPKCIEISSAVNYVARTWKLSPIEPKDAGLLFLISRFLSTGYLWDKVRVEGGAYGGMSVMSISHPIFSCASYRDPNLTGTLTHFENGLKLIAQGVLQEKIDQNIIGAIGKIDSPLPPHSQGLGEAIDTMIGYTRKFRQDLRDTLLSATTEDLKNLASKIIANKENCITILGGGAAFDNAFQTGFVGDRESLII